MFTVAKDQPDHEKIVTDPEAVRVFEENAVESAEDEIVIDEVFIDGDGRIKTAGEVSKLILQKSMRCFDTEQIHSEVDNDPRFDIAKFVGGSSQNEAELGHGIFDTETGAVKVVEPPYPPEVLSKFLEVDETHYRCVKTKVTDSVGRPWEIGPITKQKGEVFDPSSLSEQDRNEIDGQTLEVRQFIENCNDVVGFEGVLERSAMDHEGVGWAAFEVIRSLDMKIARLSHIPSSRIRVLRGFNGFVEVVGPEKYVHYQLFGQKVVSRERVDPVTNKKEPYDPRLDGDLDPDKQDWNLINRDTGKSVGGENLGSAANELMFLPKHHSNTIYYGIGDVVPALGHIMSNIHIRDYLLQFFDHNTVPQYAVIVEGAKMAPDVIEQIQKFFGSEVKGQAHKTLIVPIPATGREVKVKFEKLGSDKEASFQDTRKANQQNIMTAHGVSPAIIGIADNANLGSGKGLSQAEIYKDRIVTPSQTRWEKALNRLFRLGLGATMVGIKFERLDIRDLELEAKVETMYSDRGLKTPNEVRKTATLGDPIQGGDRPFFVMKGSQVLFLDTMEDDLAAIKEAEEQVAMLRTQMQEAKLSQMQNQDQKQEQNQPVNA